MSEGLKLISQLLKCDVFRVGEFILKSGVTSPVYIDLRRVISYPSTIRNLAEAVRSKQLQENLISDVVCGVPYTALPVASVYSVLYDIPMVMKRKEVKTYGTKKMVEGVFDKGSSCLIVEDIVSSGSSVIETAQALREEGLIVNCCIVIIDRLQGGKENLAKEGITLHSLFNINDIFSQYIIVNEVDSAVIKQVNTYLYENKFIPVKKAARSAITFAQRASKASHPVAKKLFEIMDKKETNLCVAVDTVSSKDLLKLANELGPHICLLKTHIDILNDFSETVVTELCKLANTYEFLILEDRKFADIGSTVKHQYENGMYKIKDWADIVTVHGIPGNGIINALKTTNVDSQRASILIAEMSSKGALTDYNYREKIIKLGESHPDFVIGYICQQKLTENESVIHMCPGVHISNSCDTFGQQYTSPEDSIGRGADIIIVGRGICGSSNAISMAVKYKTRAFNAYLNYTEI